MDLQGSFSQRSLENRITVVRAMSHLVKSMTLDKISVIDICEEAQISKATFYRLFPSKYNVLQWVISIYSNMGIDQIGRTLNWHDGLACTTFGLDQHSELLYAANRTSQIFDAPRQYTVAKRYENIAATINDWHHKTVTPELDFQILAWSKLSASLAAEWHSGFFKYSEEKYIDLLESVVPQKLHDLLDTPAFPDGEDEANKLHGPNWTTVVLAKAMLDTV